MGKARPEGAAHQPQSRLSARIGARVKNTGARIVTDGRKNRHRSISGSDAERALKPMKTACSESFPEGPLAAASHPGQLDTLEGIQYARGDIENAVRRI